MIERYFHMGVRFKWTKQPDDVVGSKDGSIVLQNATPGTMTYDGMDGELVDPTFHASSLGLTMRAPINYNWLNYKPGHTSKLALSGDTLSGYMSGCYICTWTEGGQRYVGHIGTVDAEGPLNERVRKVFREAMPRDVQGYSPASHWDRGEIQKMANRFKSPKESRVFSLVTSAGQFYAIVMFNMQNNEWCVGGIKSVPATAYHALRTKLGGTGFLG